MGLDSVKKGYRSEVQVSRYDKRFSGLRGRLNNRIVLKTIRKAYGRTKSGACVLDVPCGTGRLQGVLGELSSAVSVQADVSMEMLSAARKKQEENGGANRFVQCDLTRLPFKDKSFQAAFNVRFMQHLKPRERVVALKELGRVCEKLVVCYYHRYTFKTLSRFIRSKLRLYGEVPVKASRADLKREADAAGLKVQRVRRVVPLFSDNWVVTLKSVEAPGR